MTILYYLDMLGVAVFAISGVLAAGRKNLDLVGVLVLAVLTSLGGGTARDLLLNREAVFWVADSTYLWVVLVTTIAAVIFGRNFRFPTKALLFFDALGLGLFTMIGAYIAELEGVSIPVIVVMGVVTGAAGGVMRDALVGEVPLIFRSTEAIYSIAAFTGAVLYVGLKAGGMDQLAASLLGAGVIITFRLAAIFWRIHLPPVKLLE